jgi:hypothetical protein
MPVIREVLRDEDILGVDPLTVDDFILVGQYRQNPVWQSDTYKILMRIGFEMNMPWARSEMEDLQRAYAKPVAPEEMAATRERLERLERELSE